MFVTPKFFFYQLMVDSAHGDHGNDAVRVAEEEYNIAVDLVLIHGHQMEERIVKDLHVKEGIAIRKDAQVLYHLQNNSKN